MDNFEGAAPSNKVLKGTWAWSVEDYRDPVHTFDFCGKTALSDFHFTCNQCIPKCHQNEVDHSLWGTQTHEWSYGACIRQESGPLRVQPTVVAAPGHGPQHRLGYGNESWLRWSGLEMLHDSVPAGSEQTARRQCCLCMQAAVMSTGIDVGIAKPIHPGSDTGRLQTTAMGMFKAQ